MADTASTSAAAAASYGIVNAYSSGDPTRISSSIQLPYQASLFAMHQRLKETGALVQADHVSWHLLPGITLCKSKSKTLSV